MLIKEITFKSNKLFFKSRIKGGLNNNIRDNNPDLEFKEERAVYL